MAYAGYQGYDPELDRLKQRRDIAEALQQGALDTGPKSLPEGIAQIGKALIARQAMKKANKAGDAYKSNQDRIADLFVSQMFPGDAAAMAYPESPTPANQASQGALGAVTPRTTPPGAVPSVAPAQPQVGSNQTSQAMPGAVAKRGAMTPWSIPDPGMAALGQSTPPAGAMPPQGSAAPMAGRGGFTPQQQQAGADAAQVRAMIRMGMNPMEAASTVKGEQRQRQADALAAEERAYTRGIDDRDFRQRADQFGITSGLQRDQLGQDATQFGVTSGLSAAELAEKKRQFDAELALKKAEAESKALNGDPEFTAAQNARIYSDSMDAADAAMKNQGRLDTIARAALQFVENSKDYNSQGEGWWNDLGQALSMDTTGLKQLTDTIAPLIREPGSGGNSDADVNMFKSSVVSINNTKQANVNFAKGAQALAARNKEYVSYLSDAIEPNDPKSRQNANRIWLAYANENPMFDPKTGEVRTPPRFKDWLDVKTGNAPPVNSFVGRRVQSAAAALAPPPQTDDVSDLLEKYRQ